MAFMLKKFLQSLFLPPLLPMLLVAVGSGLAWKKKKPGIAVILSGLTVSVFFSMPLTVTLMTRGLETIAPVRPEQLETAGAIVILGGGQRGWAGEYGRSMPSRGTLERLCYGATLARRTRLPVLVTGGAPSGGNPESDVMEKTLADLFGVKTAWNENRALDTADNARFSGEILKREGIGTVVLVTHASHMRRAANEFRSRGLTVVPAPTAFFSHGMRGKPLFGLVPDMESIYQGYYVTHEWVGLLVQGLRKTAP